MELADPAAGRMIDRRTSAPHADLVRAIRANVFAKDPEYRRWGKPGAAGDALADYLFATPSDPRQPQEVFDRLRWGGQLVFVSRSEAEVAELSAKYRNRRGFILEREPARFYPRFWGLLIPGLARPVHYFVARKILIVPPGRSTDRFTYDVRLVQLPRPYTGYAVLKQIPEYGQVVARLRERLPEATMETILKGARKLVDKVFPVFLTREAAFLSILKRDLPEPYNRRVPKLIDVHKDAHGFVQKLYLEWLRNGCDPMSQLEFARQSADLLRALHEKAGVIHLDLRLDNFVITERGVGFVDFGSAVRIGENLGQNPMLQTLFAEMMTTSQIQRDLGKMVRKGKVTSRMLVDSHQKVDKAVDLFYLALQMNDPHANPDFVDLIRYNSQGDEARKLSRLTYEILKPSDPDNPPFRSAADICAALARL